MVSCTVFNNVTIAALRIRECFSSLFLLSFGFIVVVIVAFSDKYEMLANHTTI